jgi:large subunit ribosomal protein L18
VINDETGTTLAAASSTDKDVRGSAPESKDGGKIHWAKAVGQALAKVCKEKNITTVAFDRNGYKYHGRVKAVAEGAREGGLDF